MNLRWRPARQTPFLIGAWCAGSIGITAIVAIGPDPAFRVYVFAAWGVLFCIFTYIVFSLVLNSTRVGVTSGKLIVENGPLPWWGDNSTTDLASVTDVVVSSYVRIGRGTASRVYTVLARASEGRSIPIVTVQALDKESDAESIASTIRGLIWHSGS